MQFIRAKITKHSDPVDPPDYQIEVKSISVMIDTDAGEEEIIKISVYKSDRSGSMCVTASIWVNHINKVASGSAMYCGLPGNDRELAAIYRAIDVAGIEIFISGDIVDDNYDMLYSVIRSIMRAAGHGGLHRLIVDNEVVGE